MTPDSPTDLSKRLREEADNFVADPEDATDFDFRIARRLREAADEIERLTKALKEADAALIAVGRQYVYRGEDTGSIREGHLRRPSEKGPVMSDDWPFIVAFFIALAAQFYFLHSNGWLTETIRL